MNDSIRVKLKKYVLYISTIFFVTLGAHLICIYSYEGAGSEAIEGGSVSEAIIGSFPNFNPLVPSNDHNSYINGLLYRSLLEYSTVSGNFESDLASCDRENLLFITCSIDINAQWSDGTNITPDDIKATLNIIKETKVNPIIASLLEGSTIETGKDTISFSNTTKDINFLQVLLQPIMPAKVIERLNSDNIDGKISEINGIYSGRFTLASISQDETVGITKITLGKNENYFENDMYIQFLILNLFRDETHFLKNRNTFNIFNDNEGIMSGSIPRLEENKYTLSQFVASFFNNETLDIGLRKYISNSLSREDIVEEIGNDTVEMSLNPFLSDINIDTDDGGFDITAFMQEQDYFTKERLLEIVLQQETQAVSEQNPIISNEAQLTPSQPTKTQSNLSYVTSPSAQKYNFVSEDNILIQGNVDPGVEAVYINDYRLEGYSPGDDVFYYRLLESFDSISQGENSYKIYFETNSSKTFIEEFSYIYYSDSEKLSEIEGSFFDIENTDTDSDIVQQREGSTLGDSETAGIQLSSEYVQSLSDTLYYNTSGEAYSIDLVYTQADASMETAVQKIKSLLEANGIAVNLSVVNLGDITVKLRNESLEYDIMVLGINLGYFDSNIFPYFHSSQVQNGYNFSNYKKLSADILLEELKSNNLELSKRKQLEEKMLEIFRDEAIIKVFYTPKISILVDKNIKNYNFPTYIPDSKHRYYPLLESYLTEKRVLNLQDKSLKGFIVFLVQKLFS